MEENKNGKTINAAAEKVEQISGENGESLNPSGTNHYGSEKKALSRERKEELRAEKRLMIAKIKEERKTLMEKNREKAAVRKAERQARQAERKQKNREQGRGHGGYVAAIVSLGIATLVLASVLTYTFLMPTESDTTMESVYRKSFYDTVDQVNNIDLNMSKILATNDKAAVQGYLLDLAVNSELAENDLQTLPLEDESKFYTTKLVNQIGDFSKYMNKKIAAGETITEEDKSTLINLYEANLALKDALKKMNEDMDSDFSFSSLLDGGSGNVIVENFTELENLSTQYPELIYDGPFSDGKDNREIKGLSGETVSDVEAKDEYLRIFGDYGVSDVNVAGGSDGKIPVFNVQGTVENMPLYAQFSKTGNKLVMFSYAGSCNEVNYEQDKAIASADAFLSAFVAEGLKPVWVNLSNNLYTINYAGDLNGVTVYPDLVKVRVCAETCKVIGLEATSYYTNHTERTVDSPALTEKQAAEKVSGNIGIVSARLAIIPVGEKTEKLCYEFSGEYDGTTYYAYIDASSGAQIEMFKVVESTEGTLLM